MVFWSSILLQSVWEAYCCISKIACNCNHPPIAVTIWNSWCEWPQMSNFPGIILFWFQVTINPTSLIVYGPYNMGYITWILFHMKWQIMAILGSEHGHFATIAFDFETDLSGNWAKYIIIAIEAAIQKFINACRASIPRISSMPNCSEAWIRGKNRHKLKLESGISII